MPAIRSPEYLGGLVRELLALPRESEWVEFKRDYADPQGIGEYISALANGAALKGKPSAYLVWGVENSTHDAVGTDFSLLSAKKGNEPLENWLLRSLAPRIDFGFHEVEIEGRRLALLEIDRASQLPVSFSGVEFIRVGSAKKKLKEYPEKERELWRIFDRIRFEDGVAAERMTDEDVALALDHPAYFDLLGMPIPDRRAAILDAFQQDDLIARCDAGGWNITNMGAVLFAKNLDDFPGLKRKATRVVQYKGTGRMSTLRELPVVSGYATGFSRMIETIMTLVPSNEAIEQSLRKDLPMFPDIAVRELVANALIHQDFFATGTGPMVEIFDDRMEITNPGEPLVDTNRFVDSPPKSRNEKLASLMRRLGVCEERGSGIDKVVHQAELFQLPAPLFESPVDFTRASLFSYKSLSEMDKSERVRACYLHACLCYVLKIPMNNSSIRKRFGISEQSAARASRLLNEALDSECIIIKDPTAGNRSRAYLPYWAG